MSDTRALRWFKSSYSDSGGGDCVEIAACTHTIHIRDPKNPDGPALTVTAASWTAFLTTPRPEM